MLKIGGIGPGPPGYDYGSERLIAVIYKKIRNSFDRLFNSSSFFSITLHECNSLLAL